MKAYVLIKAQTGEIPEVLRQLRSLKAIASADMIFGPYDVVAVVDTKDLNTLGQTVAREVQPVIGVEETLTCPIIDGV